VNEKPITTKKGEKVMAEMTINEEKSEVGVITFSITGKAGRHEFFRYGNFLTKEKANEVAEDLKLYETAAPITK